MQKKFINSLIWNNTWRAAYFRQGTFKHVDKNWKLLEISSFVSQILNIWKQNMKQLHLA